MESGFGGIDIDDSLTLIVRPNELGAARPRPRESVTYNGRPYQIETIERAPQNAFYKLSLVSGQT